MTTQEAPRESNQSGTFAVIGAESIVSRVLKVVRAAVRIRNLPLTASIIVLCVTLLAAVLAPWLPLPAPEAFNLKATLRPPGIYDGQLHLFGTDNLGRDVLSRIIWGARITAAVGTMAVFLSGTIGGLLGLISGYSRAGTGKVIMAIADIQMSMPPLILALGFIAVLGPGLTNVIVVVALTGWPQYARIIDRKSVV